MRANWLMLTAVFVCLACSSGSDKASEDTGADLVTQPETVDLTTVDAPDVVPEEDLTVVEVAEVEADVQQPFPPRELPFVFTRPAAGEPLSDAEVTEFTKQVSGLWKKIGWARWLLRTSTGVDPSTGKEDYLAWYNDVHALKEGDTVTFRQTGGDHNMWIPGSKILSQVINGCALTGEWDQCKLAEQYCKGLTASVKGFIWDEDDPAPFLMARAVFPMDQEFTLDEETWKDDGRKKNVEFSGAYVVWDGWNAHTFEWPHNPTWGYMWVTNMRSKDDVCAIVRTTLFLPYIIADAPYDWVRDACQETMDTMVGFNKDIVDYGYYIRTKDADGTARLEEVEDLGNYVWYSDLDPLSECPARLATDLIAYNEPLTNDCGSGFGSVYDMVAPGGNHYNYPIIWNYHMAALGNAMVHGYNDIAYNLLGGLAERLDTYLDPETKEPGIDHHAWQRDMAVLLVQSAAVGLPLTADETRHVHKHWLKGVEELTDWPNWDLWSPDVPDGEYPAGNGMRPPSSDEGLPRDAIALFLEYCNSPFRNSDGAKFIDCDIVADPEKWGE